MYYLKKFQKYCWSHSNVRLILLEKLFKNLYSIYSLLNIVPSFSYCNPFFLLKTHYIVNYILKSVQVRQLHVSYCKSERESTDVRVNKQIKNRTNSFEHYLQQLHFSKETDIFFLISVFFNISCVRVTLFQILSHLPLFAYIIQMGIHYYSQNKQS